MIHSINTPAPQPLSGPYLLKPDSNALRPSKATVNLVRSQVKALLMSNPSFQELSKQQQSLLANSMVKISAYAAECVRDDWYQSTQHLQQRPLVKRATMLQAPIAVEQAAGSDLGAPTNRVARVTEQTLRAIAFPTFVADLIQGTFNAIINANIKQLESYSNLLGNVGKTVDQFMTDNISDNQARDWLAQRYPETLLVKKTGDVPRLRLRPGAEDRAKPNWRSELHLSEEVELDEDSIEEKLVPAARRQLAQQRLQILSTMVMMGLDRISVIAGKIRATMGFHIDASERLHQEHATDFDFRTAAGGSYGFGPWQAQASMSVAYVRSTRATSDEELNVEADLTGEVEIHFKGDHIPLERFATDGQIDRIRGNTPVPEKNDPFGAISAGGTISPYKSPRTQRKTERSTQAVRPIGTLPEKRMPEKPDAPSPRPVKPDGNESEDSETATA